MADREITMLTDQERPYHVANYGAFLKLSQEQKIAHDGEYALFDDGCLIAFYPTNRQAIQSAYQQGLQGKYSVLRVRPQPEDMGFFDCANYPR